MKVSIKTAKTTADVISAGINAIKSTDWYNGLSDKRKSQVTEYNLQSVLKASTKEITLLDDKIENLRQRIKDRKTSNKEAYEEIKAFLKDKKIKGIVTPTEINRLINRASRLIVARDLDKTMDKFILEYDKVSEKARKRAISRRKKNKDIDGKFVTDMTEMLIANGKSIDDILDYFESPREQKVAQAVWDRHSDKDISDEEALRLSMEAYEEADAIINKKLTKKEQLERFKRVFIKNVSDRQFLPKHLTKKSGMKGTYNLMINSNGSSGKANRMFQEAYKKIYYKLDKKDRKLLDIIIHAKRVIAIDNNREERGLGKVRHTKGTNREREQKTLNRLRNELGEKKYNDLIERADNYFDVFKQILKDSEKSGLISKEVKEMFENVDYQPRLFIKHITNFNEEVNLKNESEVNKNNGGLSQDQIKSMTEGDAGALIMNSSWLLSTALNTRYKSIAINNVNKKFMAEEFPKAKERYEALLDKEKKGKELSREDKRFKKYFSELDSKIKDNPIIGVTQNGTPKYKYDSAPPHFAKAYYYEDGVQHSFFIEKELHDQWFNNLNGFLSSTSKEIFSLATGSQLLKGVATGNNPGFVVVNTPRDFLFTSVFSKEYSPILLKAMYQVAKDSFKGVKEINSYGKGREDNMLRKYIEYGGDMSFLSTQGRLKKDSALGRSLDALVDPKSKDSFKAFFDNVTLKKLGEYSEIMFRLGVFNRSIKNQLKDLGYKDISEIKDNNLVDDIYNEAVASARSILDFNQGGTITKDLEAFIPYINTGVQGTRVAIDRLQEDGPMTVARMLQAAALGTSAPIGISLALISMLKSEEDEDKSVFEIFIEAINGISKYQKSQYFNIITGRKIDGEYEVIKIAKNQQIAPIMSLTDNFAHNKIRRIIGAKERETKYIYKDAWFSFNSNIMPVDITSPSGFITRNPAAKAILTYGTGHDFFRDQPLTMDINNVPREVEGFKSKSVEDFYKKLGEEYELSPARMKGAVESLITSPSTNPFIAMMYGAGDAIASDKDFKSKSKDFGESILKSVGKRFLSKTSQFNRNLEADEKIKVIVDREEADKIRHDFYGNELVKKFVNKEITHKEFNKQLNEKYSEDTSRLINKMINYSISKDFNPVIMNIMYEKTPRIKALKVLHYFGDVLDGSPGNKEIFKQLMLSDGIITGDFIIEYNKIKKEILNK